MRNTEGTENTVICNCKQVKLFDIEDALYRKDRFSDVEKEFEDGGINFDIFSKEESSGEYTYIMYFYYGKEKYIVIGRNDEERIRDIVIAYKNVILSHEGNQQ